MTYIYIYIYNVKIHKPNNPLRPIISQTPTPCYKLAKRLNELLKPFIPAKYSLSSVDEFIDILRTTNPTGQLASIDVESLFTNVPVETTIQIIIKHVYHNTDKNMAPLKLTPSILEGLLRACTMESPFRAPNGKLFKQKDGIAMGSPLGPLFANFYMCELENGVLSDPEIAPNIYCRYVDDVFLDIRDPSHLDTIISRFEDNSVLHFTSELSVNDKIPFLDVLVSVDTGQFTTSVYQKPSNTGKVMNAQSECPERYKKSVMRAFIRRAHKHCSSYELLHSELSRIKQVLVNNGYSNSEVDREIKAHLDKTRSVEPEQKKE